MKFTYLKDIDIKSLTRSSAVNIVTARKTKQIIENVRLYGDEALLRYNKKFNGSEIENLRVTTEEVQLAYSQVEKEYILSLKKAIRNITKVTQSQFLNLNFEKVETEKGIFVWREWRAIEKVGLYVPGGKASYPSTVLMTAIPAQIAGCTQVIICTPPGPNGVIPSSTLVAADMVGIKNIFKVGGAEAIAAMAYGTKTIPKVYKIFGPGNRFVTEAKTQLLTEVAIDLPAGPSEVFIIADDSANPKFIASDLLADCEHAEDSSAVLVSLSKKIIDETIKQIGRQLKHLSTKERIIKSLNNNGLFVLVDSLNEGVNFCNLYAPEHVEIMTHDPDKLVSKITNAGSVFLGPWTAKASGDYATGANHVLPTGGRAKMYSPLSVDSFGKMMEIQKVVSQKALGKINKEVQKLAEIENLPAHKNSMAIRFERR
jgi:histidinol dehydrogenase